MAKVLHGSKKSNTILDTLEVTSDFYISKSHETQCKQAIRKGSQITKLKQLVDVTSPDRVKGYWKTYHCNRIKLQEGDKLKGSLCRKRWCQHCNRIRTYELLNGYLEPLKELKDPHFVTLTAPTVNARELRSEIQKRYKAFTRIKDNIRKNYKLKINGIRKTEVTFTDKGKYHPHFHLIVDGYDKAKMVQDLWLKQFKRANIKAQDISKIDIEDPECKGLIEVFKYAAKDVTSDTTTAKAMDNIYRSIEGVRTIQTYGSVSKVKSPKEANSESSIVDWIPPRNEIWLFDERKSNFFNAAGENLLDIKGYYKTLKDTDEEIHQNIVESP